MRGPILLTVWLGAALAGASTVDFTYDDAGRLLQADYGNGRVIDYVYDDNGNVLSRTVTVAPEPIPPTMTATRSGSDVLIAYDVSGCNASDHAVLSGSLGDFSTVTGADCSVGSTGSAVLSAPSGIWFLVAGVEGSDYSPVGQATAGPRAPAGVTAVCPTLTALDATATCP